MDTILVPPYTDPLWRNYTSVSISPYIWVSYRHRPLPGEIIMQMGTKPGSTSVQDGSLTIGFQHSFKTPVNLIGPERWIAEVSPGPISRWSTVPYSVYSTVGIRIVGPGFDGSWGLYPHSYQPTWIYADADLRADTKYSIAVYGQIYLRFAPNESPYSEIIATFPRVWRVDKTQDIRSLADERTRALKPGKPVLQKITLEEAIRAGDAGFAGGSDSTPPEERPPATSRST
ncbi:MAG: hypothetical protein ABI779_01635 [Acidobacteriota bacterium]